MCKKYVIILIELNFPLEVFFLIKISSRKTLYNISAHNFAPFP